MAGSTDALKTYEQLAGGSRAAEVKQLYGEIDDAAKTLFSFTMSTPSRRRSRHGEARFSDLVQ